MSSIPLRLGAFGSDDFAILRSGVRWLREDGQSCRRGDVLGYCNIGIGWKAPKRWPPPLAEEYLDLQAAFLSPASGRLRKAEVSFGGFLDRHPLYQRWKAETVIGHLEYRPGERPPDADVDSQMPLLMLAGRRVTPLAEDRSGLLSGWHDRARAWRADAAGTPSTIMSLGICEQTGIFRGERDAFLELASLLGPSAHIVWASDDLLVPSARVLFEQMYRTPHEHRAIAADVAERFTASPHVPMGADWMFVGGLLSALGRSPLVQEYDLLTRTAIVHVRAADAFVLSLQSEQAHAFKHRRLGYTVSLHGFRLDDAGDAVKAWLRSDFEFVFRPADEIYRDYLAVIDAVRAIRSAEFLIINTCSSSANDRFYGYAEFDAPLGKTVSSYRAKELNLMLYELARERGVKIVDADARVAQLGAGVHLPDGVHQSGELQAALREQIARYVS